MVSKYATGLGLVAVVVSASATAGGNGWDYSGGNELPFAGTHQTNEPSVNFSYGSGDSTPKIWVENKKGSESTGNISIDRSLQQETERCNRIRNQLRSKDAGKLNC